MKPLILLCCLGLVACGGSSNSASTTGGNASGGDSQSDITHETTGHCKAGSSSSLRCAP